MGGKRNVERAQRRVDDVLKVMDFDKIQPIEPTAEEVPQEERVHEVRMLALLLASRIERIDDDRKEPLLREIFGAAGADTLKRLKRYQRLKRGSSYGK